MIFPPPLGAHAIHENIQFMKNDAAARALARALSAVKKEPAMMSERQ
jgi:hypothetical protein